ncbi:uncharacterized protein LOC117314606 [Pecten maximus]|uniref:uncharacterized protein LOC117314606 n=1 Tax=Pecten maximus TaxID=6579 RepID=UPI0014582072|nr:uncharacterized protein LOC117314606 [Pecten maximus]
MPDRPSTPLNIERLAEELQNHPDRHFVDYLIEGLKQGFDTKVSTTSLPTKECKNLQSANNNATIVDTLISSELEKGFLCGPFQRLPFEHYRVSPIGVAIGKYSKKPRLIVDLSSPHEDTDHPSINELIDKEQCSLSYVKIDDAVNIIQSLGRNTTMCKTDISDAFKLIPIHPSQWHLFCVQWKGSYYFYNKLAFGCRSSPKIFDTLSEAVCWIAQHNYGISHIMHLLDDFITFDGPGVCGERNMALLYLIFNRLNIPMAKHKTCGPETVIEYLGIILDSINMEARLPVDKLVRITEFLTDFLSKSSCTKREMLQLLGHLNFASRVVIPSRAFVSHLIRCSTTVKHLHHYIRINNDCREDIRMWRQFLLHWNGVSMFYNTRVITSDDLRLFTDASGTRGFGGIFQQEWFAEPWPTSLRESVSQVDELSIAFKELYPIVVAALLWGHKWVGQRIVFMCDNSATVAILQKGRSKSAHIMPLMRRLTLCAATHNFCILSKHVPGRHNVIADSLSRLQLQKFRHLVPTACKYPRTVPAPAHILWSSSL